MTAVLATGSPALWYLTRGTGAVTLVLLTLSVLFGILEVERWTVGTGPRFVVGSLHRSVSLLVLALLAVHVATAVLDTFAPIRILDAVIPFTGVYRPLWLGLGALALDGLVALVLTSLVRRRLGLRAWRAAHWIAYGCWPVAVLHGLGTGSDAKTAWMQALTAICALAVVGAVVARLARSGPGNATVRAGGAVALTVLLLGVALWLPSGPLGPGWARRSGTPASLLAFGSAASARAAATAPAAAPDVLAGGFSGAVDGTLRQGLSRDGTAVVDIRLHAQATRIRVRMGGQPVAGGGLGMTESAVYLGPPSDPTRYRGRVTQLDGAFLRADVGAPGGHVLRLSLDLQLQGDQVSGAVEAVSPGGGG
ncbi:MAG: hypothetical protein ACXVFN_14325 [Solirubrobacteraceae bacterium]